MQKKLSIILIILLFVSFLIINMNISDAIIISKRNNLVAYYRFDEQTGTNCYDYSGSGYDGTYSTSLHNLGFFSNSSYLVTCNTQYVDLGNVSRFNLDGKTGLTVSIWAKPTVIGTTHYILSSRSAVTESNESMLEIYINSANNYKFYLGKTGGGAQVVQSSTLAVINDTINVVGRFNGTYIDIFTNGSLTGSQAMGGTTALGNSSLYVGKRAITGTAFSGFIDELQMYDTALTNSEILELYNYNSNTPPPVSQNIDFSVVHITDIQNLAESNATLLDSLTSWISQEKTNYNISSVHISGDFVNTYSSSTEWNNINISLSTLYNNNIPYVWCAGNHDALDSNSSFGGNDYYYLNNSVLSAKSYFVTSYNYDMKNTAIYYSIGNYNFLSIGIQYQANQTILDWADNLIQTYNKSNVIIATHSYIDESASFNGGWETNFDSWLDSHGSVFLVFCGHVHGQTLASSQGFRQSGNRTEMFFERQEINNNLGASSARIISFNLDSKNVTVSTWYNDNQVWQEDEKNYFSFTTELYEDISYTLNTIINTPINGTYHTTDIPVSLTYSGNDTGISFNWNIQFSNGTWLYETNKTVSSFTSIINENLTNIKLAVETTGNFVTDYKEVIFSINTGLYTITEFTDYTALFYLAVLISIIGIVISLIYFIIDFRNFTTAKIIELSVALILMGTIFVIAVNSILSVI